ncbi:hypothetical protein H6A16_05515 [Collinsella tanakaei]|uniref:hypothetical protein n=1 Tax=Collinsella tanakaei TaxID=626935 RepID=UPI001959D776|nr:hypothetical protein [Collinsella tanakaei]MBM6778949.1 hypothetical protein [Collinsella tanakaei]
MSKLSPNSLVVKGISLFFVIFGLATVAVAAIMFFGAPEVDLQMEDGAQIAQMYAVIAGVIGLFEFICGFIGMRAAKHHKLLKPYTYLVAVMVFVNLSLLGTSLLNHVYNNVWQHLVSIAVAFTAIVFASRALNEDGTN